MVADNALAPANSDSSSTFRLTDDVLVCALEFLTLPQLRSTAGVSHKFYAASWRSGLYIHRKITDWSYSYLTDRADADPKVLDRKIMIWHELVDHALEKHLRLALTIQWGSHGDVVLKEGTQSFSLLAELLCSITTSLPILVSLSITIGGFAYPRLRDALKDPAPCLRSLFLHSDRDEKPLGPIAASSDLFSGKAPQLRELGLDSRSLGSDPLPVFANVVRFSTQDCDLGTRVPLRLLFPKLVHLRIVSDDPEESQVPPPQVDLSSVTLRSFSFHNTTWKRAPDIERTLNMPAINVFHYIVDDGKRREWGCLSLGWRDSRFGKLSLYLPPRRSFGNVRLMSADESWRRSYIFKTSGPGTDVYSVPNIVAQLAYLRLDYRELFSLIRCATHFVALRRLRVDVVTLVDYGSSLGILDRRLGLEDLEDEEDARRRFPVRCPLLESVAIIMTCNAPETHLALDRVELYILGRVLGAGAKPVLELADIAAGRPFMLSDEVPQNGASIDVLDVFSAVRHVPCGRCVVLDGFDGEEWDDSEAIDADRYLMQSLPW